MDILVYGLFAFVVILFFFHNPDFKNQPDDDFIFNMKMNGKKNPNNNLLDNNLSDKNNTNHSVVCYEGKGYIEQYDKDILNCMNNLLDITNGKLVKTKYIIY
jgi:hypothetical protein